MKRKATELEEPGKVKSLTKKSRCDPSVYFYVSMPSAYTVKNVTRDESSGAIVRIDKKEKEDAPFLDSWKTLDLVQTGEEIATLREWFKETIETYVSRNIVDLDFMRSDETKLSAKCVLAYQKNDWSDANEWFCTDSEPLYAFKHALPEIPDRLKKKLEPNKRTGSPKKTKLADKERAFVARYNSKLSGKKRTEKFLIGFWNSFFSKNANKRISVPMPRNAPWTLFTGEGRCESRLWDVAKKLKIGETFHHLPQISSTWHFNVAADFLCIDYTEDPRRCVVSKTIFASGRSSSNVNRKVEDYAGGIVILKYDPKEYEHEKGDEDFIQSHFLQEFESHSKSGDNHGVWQECEILLQPGLKFKVSKKRFLKELENVSPLRWATGKPVLVDVPLIELTIVGRKVPEKPKFELSKNEKYLDIEGR